MAIKAGQILHIGNKWLIDRAQSIGVSNLNQASETIRETGNFETVGIIFEIPDLSFDIESFDVSNEVEALSIGLDPTALTAGQEIDFIHSKPMFITSPFKDERGIYTAHKGIVVPALNLESVTYRFGVRANATEQFTFRGDSVYYTAGVPTEEEFSGNGSTTVFAFANTATIFHDELGNDVYALGVCVYYSDGTYRRMFIGEDFTNTSAGLTFLVAPPAGSTIRVAYSSTAAATFPQSLHATTGVKPSAVRAKDIDVYIGTNAATPVFSRWDGVQNFETTRRVTLDNDEEFGNPHYVSQDYDTADVSGTITVKSVNVDNLFTKIAQIADVPTTEVVGVNTSVTLPIELRIRQPGTSTVLKTIYIPDARIRPPATQVRPLAKLETPFPFTSESGTMLVYNGLRA